jgi:molybdopterin/thiamine biosynthesis adenylyltransferase
MLRFDRIQHLISPDDLRDKLVVQVGVGSGGAPANEHLTMNGVRRWILFDPDTYEEVNLVKHPRPRSDIGNLKVDNQKKWILDRNPDADVEVVAEDVLKSSRFQEAVKAADVVLCCTDTQVARLFVNSVAVEMHRPCVTASVFRRGFGGEVYAYVPSVSGCFNCMMRVAEEQGWNLGEAVELLPVEEEAIYGLNRKDFRASGLSMDIQTISILQARMTLDVLLTGTDRHFAPLPANWMIFYNRPIPNVSKSGFLKNVQFNIKPRRDCACKGL